MPAGAERIAARAAAVSLAATAVVVAFKLLAAGLSGSVSVTAEALQSTLDVAMSALALVTIRVAAKPPDREHPYGHGKAELLLSAFQMIVVILTAVGIAWFAVLRLMNPRPLTPDWGIAAMGYAALSNLVVIGYLQRVGKRTNSAALLGEAEHLRGDLLASLGVLLGLLAYSVTRLPWIDPAVAIAFTLLAITFAARQLVRTVHPLMDGALPEEELHRLEEVLRAHPQVRGFHNVRTRDSGRLRTVLLHVMLDDALSFVHAHEIAEQIEDELQNALAGAMVTVHYEPYLAELAHRAEAHAEQSARP